LPNGSEQWEWCSAKMFAGSANFGPSTLYEIASILLRRTPPNPFDTDVLLNKTCTIHITRSQPDADGRTKAKVDGHSQHSDAQLAEVAQQMTQRPQITDSDLPF
jgi:hypothetical protein